MNKMVYKPNLEVEYLDKGFYYGWDYAHIGDFTGMDLNFPPDLQTGGKQWTTEEMLEDVKKVIDTLNKLEAA